MISKAARRALRAKREVARGERAAVELELEPEMTAEEIEARGEAWMAARIAKLTETEETA